jgi:hypothetical protein
VRLAELLCPLAAAADAGAALPPETAQRTALIALGLGRALGFSSVSQSDLLYASLLRHLGCSATAHEETRLMGDEQELRSSLTPVDAASPLQMLQGASRGFAKGRSRLERARTVAGFLVRAPSVVPRIFAARCEVSARLARRLGLSEATVRALDEAYERFDGKGQPRRRRAESLSPLSGVLAAAEWLAMFLPLPGGEALSLDTLKQRAGGQFDPAVVRALDGAREEILAPARRAAPRRSRRCSSSSRARIGSWLTRARSPRSWPTLRISSRSSRSVTRGGCLGSRARPLWRSDSPPPRSRRWSSPVCCTTSGA